MSDPNGGSDGSLSAANHAILAKLGLPTYLHEESVQLQREKNKIAFIRDAIDKCQSVTDSMHSELDEFTSRMEALEAILRPLDSDTRALVTTGQRLDSVVTDVTQIIDNYAIAHESDLQVSERRIEVDYNGYLEWVGALRVASAFWGRNLTFKHADRTLRRIKDLLRKGVLECQVEFERVLSIHTRVPDLSRLPWPLPDTLELIPENIVTRLAAVAQSLDSADNRAYLDSLQTHRGAFLKLILKRTVASGYNPFLSLAASESGTAAAAAAASASAAHHPHGHGHGGGGGGGGSAAGSLVLAGPGTGAGAGGAGGGMLTVAGSHSGPRANGTGTPSPQVTGASAVGATPVAGLGNFMLSRSGVGSLAVAASVVRQTRLLPLPGALTPGGGPAQAPASGVSTLGLGGGNLSTMGGDSNLPRNSIIGAPGTANATATANSPGGAGQWARPDPTAMAAAAAAAAIAAGAGAGTGGGYESGGERVGRYVRGTHRSIFYIDLALRVWELETELWYNVVHSTSLEAEDLDDRLALTLAESLDYILKHLDLCLKERSANRLLHMLDLMGHLNSNLPRFRSVLKKGRVISDQFGKITEFRRQVAEAVATAVREQHAAITDYRPDKTSLARASNKGSVSGLTVDTLTLLSQLSGYADVINQLSDSILSVSGAAATAAANAAAAAAATTAAGVLGDDADDDEPLVHRLLRMLMLSLEQTLEKQAQNTASRAPALSALFLLNNYHYIFRAASRSGLALGRGAEVRYVGKMREAQAAYSTATWGRVLTYLSVEDAPQILAQCKGSLVPDSVKPTIKRKFAGFNTTFDEIYRTQRAYPIPDADLRGQLRATNIDLILPRYRTFLATYENLTFSTKPGKYVQYSIPVLESSLNQFYDETA